MRKRSQCVYQVTNGANTVWNMDEKMCWTAVLLGSGLAPLVTANLMSMSHPTITPFDLPQSILMASIFKKSIDPRESLAGIINVTPIPIEAPIHSRPIVQSHPSTGTAASFPFTSTNPHSSNTFHWPVLILLLFLALSLGIILSKWGWSKITGRIWKFSSGWKGSLGEYDEEHLLQHVPSADAASRP